MLFEQTKSAILDSLKHGLAYFFTTKPALVTDWSKQGISFVILQKHCSCTGEVTPLCCKNGWKLASCNSRHLQPCESIYAPIEGEALAVSWALKKCKIFLLGCPKFYIFVNLIKILGNKSLAEIDNTRLFNFKEKTLGYYFDIKYIEGINNYTNCTNCTN